MTNFPLIFGSALLLNVAVTFRSSEYYQKHYQQGGGSGGGDEDDAASSTSKSTTSIRDGNNEHDDNEKQQKHAWRKILQKYLVVYLLATLSDWLQGPYVYALYADYKFSQHDIAILFVAGFGSSMVFGSFIGSIADYGGRRLFVVLFAAIYALSCVTKHFRNFKVLMIGRLLGGVATSLLFSVFDAWLIRSHSDAKLQSYLPKSFRWAAYGNSIVAIIAGLIANKAADYRAMTPYSGNEETNDASTFHIGGYIAPFDIALLSLIVCGFVARSTWEENYGESGTKPADGEVNKNTWYGGLQSAFTTTIRHPDILLCGAISSIYEGSMYIFVFMWTPALSGHGVELPFGLIFSTFMVCCMAGSSLFSICMNVTSTEQMGIGVFVTAACAMFVVAVFEDPTIKFLGMNVFEITVGMYFPIMGTMKSNIVPENKRAAIYNLYRIPLNFIVLFSLLTDLTPTTSFYLNTFMLSVAAGLQVLLIKTRKAMALAPSDTERLLSDHGASAAARKDSDV